MRGHPKPKSVIIVGGGMAGLSLGVYLQRSGYATTCFEFHKKPGGVCTSWRRGPYLMDVGLRMVIGTNPDNPFHRLYEEVGIASRVRFVPMNEFHCVEDEQGRRLRFPRDPGEFEKQMLALGPSDGRKIRKFLSILKDFGKFRPKLDSSLEVRKMTEGLRSLKAMGPVWRHFMKWWKVPLREWAMEFRSPSLRDAFLKIYPIVDFPVLAMFSSLGWFMAGHVGRPVGGALALAEAVTEQYAEQAGDLRCAHRVEKILVERQRAVGVKLEDGTEHRADIVVSAADGRATIFEMLEGRYVDDTMKEHYRSLPIFNPLVMAHYGVERDMRGEPESMYFPSRPLKIFGRTHRSLNVFHAHGDGDIAPVGHTVIRVGLESDWNPWANIREDRAKYRQYKDRISDDVLARLEKRYPGITEQVRARDVATPVTMQRYTLNHRGAYEGWQPTTRTFGLRMPKALPGLSNFYMTGQWVEPGGGVPGVLFGARHTAHLIVNNHGGKPVW